MQVIPADDNGAGHLGGDDAAGEDTSTDRDVAGEGALLVYSANTQAIVNPGACTPQRPDRGVPM